MSLMSLNYLLAFTRSKPRSRECAQPIVRPLLTDRIGITSISNLQNCEARLQVSTTCPILGLRPFFLPLLTLILSLFAAPPDFGRPTNKRSPRIRLHLKGNVRIKRRGTG